jgi:NADH-quinone oxidoreductase subunit F
LALGPGLIVIDENTCLLEMVTYFLTFLSNESCGKCIPCREGLRQMIRIMNRITSGRGRETDIERLEEIITVQKSTALCALGKGAANTLLSILKHFRNEYEIHVKEKQCPTGVCKIPSAF